MVSESIIANHTCASKFVRKKILDFVLTTNSTKILPLNFLPAIRYIVESVDSISRDELDSP